MVKLDDGQVRGGEMKTLGELGLPFKVPARVARIVAAAAEDGRGRAGRGEVDPEPDEVPVAEEVARRQAQVRKDALLKCLPDKRMNCLEGLACLWDDQHAEELRAWVEDPSARTLILAGRTGNGKTQAAYAVAGQAARYGAMMVDRVTGVAKLRPLIVRAWEVDNYLAELRPEGSKDPIWAVRDRARWAELLILDDLGAELDDVATSHMRRELAGLLGWRLERNLRTVFTTNQPAPVVEKRLGDRLWSRVQENATALRFLGPDRRAMTKLTW